MKNFDIEKLERKNIYTAPDNFFEKMQNNVIEKAIRNQPQIEEVSRTSGKVVKMNWWYAAAASVAVIFGTLFFMNGEGAQANTAIATNNAPAKNIETLSAELENVDQTPKETSENYKLLVSDIEEVEKNESAPTQNNVAITKVSPAKATKIEKSTPNVVQKEKQIEQMLEGLSEADISALAKNADQDIYLDLYY